MSIRIDGGTIVGWSGASHELIPDGSVLIEGDTISYVGSDRTRRADRVIDASGKLVCPGFINLHVHTQLNVGDHLIGDVTKQDYLLANYFVFGAPPKGLPAPPREAVAIGRRYALLTALRNGATTVLDPASGPGDWDDYVAIVGEIGGRVFFSPRYRDREIFTDAEGRHYYADAPDRGQGLQIAVEFIKKYHGAHNGRLLGILNPGQAETCEPALLKETVAAARELDMGIHIHAAGNGREFLDILYRHRKPVIEYLADTGILGRRTILGHAIFIAGHSQIHYPFADELKLLAETGTSVGHCPYKYAKMGAALESFDRYVRRGVNVGLGTDTYPMDIVSEMRNAMMIARVVDGNHLAARPADVFNAATVWGARALGREDLGRLAPGAKGDLVIVNVRDLRYGVVRDPVTSLVESGSGADVETVVVGGEVVIEGGRPTRVDGGEIYARAEQVAHRAWDNWAQRDWARRSVEQIVPPAFPTRRA
jgi:cytosine/adenosine deaminase-related metal-dependent hydrolase